MIWCPECKEDWESCGSTRPDGDEECLKCGAIFCRCCGSAIV